MPTDPAPDPPTDPAPDRPTDPAPEPGDVAPKPGDVAAATDASDGGVGSGVAGRSLPDDAALAGLVAAMGVADRAMVRVVALAGALDGSQAAREEGMTVDGALRLHTGATRSDVAQVLTAAQILSVMPITAGLFDRGIFTWGHIRAVVAQSRRMNLATRRELDDYFGHHAEQLARLDTDGRLGAIDDAVAQHTDPDRLTDRTEHAPEANVVIVTPRLDGTGTLYTDLDPEGFATVTGRLQTEADTPLAPPSPGDTGAGLPGYTTPRPSRARQLADALVRIFAHTHTDASSGVPVRFTVIIDADRVTDQIAGSIAATVAGRPPRIVRRAIDRLACDAALEVVIRDGIDLLAAKRHTPEVTVATRRAITARDQGCRFPGCRAPACWCDLHHVTQQAAGGSHEPANLTLLCRTHHTIVHRRGWQQSLAPDGSYTIARRGRRWTTLPRADTALPPPSRAGPAPPDRITIPQPATDTSGSRGHDRRPTTYPHPSEPLPF